MDLKAANPKCGLTDSNLGGLTQSQVQPRVVLTRLSSEELRPYLYGTSAKRRHDETESKGADNSTEQEYRGRSSKRTCTKEIQPNAYTQERISFNMPETVRCSIKAKKPIINSTARCHRKKVTKQLIKRPEQNQPAETAGHFLHCNEPTVLSSEERSLVIDRNKSKTISMLKQAGPIWHTLFEGHYVKENATNSFSSLIQVIEPKILKENSVSAGTSDKEATLRNKGDHKEILGCKANDLILPSSIEIEMPTIKEDRLKQPGTERNIEVISDIKSKFDLPIGKSHDDQGELKEFTSEEKNLLIDKNKTDTISFVKDQRNETNILFIRSLVEVQPAVNKSRSELLPEVDYSSGCQSQNFGETPTYDLVRKVKEEPLTNSCDEDISLSSEVHSTCSHKDKEEIPLKTLLSDSIIVHSENVNIINIYFVKSESTELYSQVHISNPLEVKYKDLFSTEMPVKLEKGEFEVLVFKENVLLLNKNLHEAISLRRDQIDAKNNVKNILSVDSRPCVKTCLELFCKQVEEIEESDPVSTRSSEETLLTDLVKMVKNEDSDQVNKCGYDERELNNRQSDCEFILGFDETNLFSLDFAQDGSNVNGCANKNCRNKMTVRCYVCRQLTTCADLCQVGGDQIVINYNTPHYNVIVLTCNSHILKQRQANFIEIERAVRGAVCWRSRCSLSAEIACLCKTRAYCSHHCREEDWYCGGHHTECAWRPDSALLITKLTSVT